MAQKQKPRDSDVVAPQFTYPPKPKKRHALRWTAAGLLVAMAGGYAWFSRDSWWPHPSTVPADSLVLRTHAGPATTLDLIAMSDTDLAKVDPLEMNLIVARELPGCETLNVGQFQKQIADWTADFRMELPALEAGVAAHPIPEAWAKDRDFVRMGMLMAFLGARKGLVYQEEHRKEKGLPYTDPKLLFVHGPLIDGQGTCANLPVVFLAIARAMGWPVVLVPAKGHSLCRWDDGKKTFNVEMSLVNRNGSFSTGPDAQYAERYGIGPDIIQSTLELHSLSPRETLGLFIAHRARFWFDKGDMARADKDYGLARYLIPRHRSVMEEAEEAMARVAQGMFRPGEQGHPSAVASRWGGKSNANPKEPDFDVARINAENQNRTDAHARWNAAMNDYNRRMSAGQSRPGEMPPMLGQFLTTGQSGLDTGYPQPGYGIPGGPSHSPGFGVPSP